MQPTHQALKYQKKVVQASCSSFSYFYIKYQMKNQKSIFVGIGDGMIM
jgi:hypothetical protein